MACSLLLNSVFLAPFISAVDPSLVLGDSLPTRLVCLSIASRDGSTEPLQCPQPRPRPHPDVPPLEHAQPPDPAERAARGAPGAGTPRHRRVRPGLGHRQQQLHGDRRQ